MRGLALLVFADEAMEARARAEVEEKPDLIPRDAQIAEQLPSRALVQLARGFDLDDQRVIDQHVEALPANVFGLVMNADQDFPGHTVTPSHQLALERVRVNRLQEPEPELPRNLIERPYHGPCQILVEKIGRHVPDDVRSDPQHLISNPHSPPIRGRNISAQSAQSA